MNDINLFDPTTAMIVGLIVSPIIPILAALISRAKTHQEITGLITLLLATANGFFTEWANAGTSFRWQIALSVAIVSYVLAVASHYGLWKDTRTQVKALAFPMAAHND